MESDENSRRETQVNRAAEQREREEQLRMEDVWPIASGLLKEKVKTKNVPAAAINLGADNDELDIFDPSNGRDRPNFYSFASGKDPKREEWLVNRQLYPHIRACITSNDFESEELAQMDTDLSICTLGTGSGAGTQLRSNPSTAIRYLGETIIIDAGEGLQKHILPSRVSLRYIRKILGMLTKDAHRASRTMCVTDRCTFTFHSILTVQQLPTCMEITFLACQGCYWRSSLQRLAQKMLGKWMCMVQLVYTTILLLQSI
jgi:hypothetical protein